ncbi:hypothetical protein OG225_27055 [Nocardia sp. NBC_01377]
MPVDVGDGDQFVVHALDDEQGHRGRALSRPDVVEYAPHRRPSQDVGESGGAVAVHVLARETGQQRQRGA